MALNMKRSNTTSQELTPPLTNSTDATEDQTATRKPDPQLAAKMKEFFSKPIDPEFAAVDKWADTTLKLATQADRLQAQEVSFIHAREMLDQRERDRVAAHEVGFKLLLEVVYALKGITEDDLGFRLQNLLDQVDPNSSTQSTCIPESKLKPVKDEAIHIRKEIAFREAQKARIQELESKLEVAEDEKRKSTMMAEKLKKDNKRLKDLLRSRARASMRLFGKMKTLEGRYEWLTKYANSLVGLTREVALSGDGLKEERKLVKMVKGGTDWRA